MTIPTQLVLTVLLREPSARRYGYDLGREAGLASGTIHPILARLESAGWVASEWEDEPSISGRPIRRYYHLTDEGATAAEAAMARISTSRREIINASVRPIGGLT